MTTFKLCFMVPLVLLAIWAHALLERDEARRCAESARIS